MWSVLNILKGKPASFFILHNIQEFELNSEASLERTWTKGADQLNL